MNDRESLISDLMWLIIEGLDISVKENGKINTFKFADYLISHGVVVQKHGRWGTHSDRPDSLICSVCNCGFDMWKHDPHNYCPNCGAKMDQEEQS